MKATCPHCGTHATLEAFLQDADAKAAVVAAATLPTELQRLVWGYLGLFRKPDAKQVMTWQRAGRLIMELAGLVNDPQIQWDGGRVVPNGAAYWVQAIQRIQDMPALRRPLEGHNLARKIAYELAEKAWHQGNVAREQQAAHREQPVGAAPRGCPLPAGQKAGQARGPAPTGAQTAGQARGHAPTGAQTDEYNAVPASQALQGWRQRLGMAPATEDQ